MSKLSNTNITWDGIGDVFENHGTSGTRSGAYIVGGGNGELQDRSPRSGGSAKSSVSANTFSADDFKGAFRVVPGHQTYQTGSSKGQVNNAIFGWGTAGGVQEFAIADGTVRGSLAITLGTIEGQKNRVLFGLVDGLTDVQRVWALTVDFHIQVIPSLGSPLDTDWALYQDFSFIQLQNFRNLLWN